MEKWDRLTRRSHFFCFQFQIGLIQTHWGCVRSSEAMIRQRVITQLADSSNSAISANKDSP
jgi:hypothetical protein